MKKTIKKLKIAMLFVLLFALLTGCNGSIATLQPQPLPDYPDIDGGKGYTVQGKITDDKGNALEGVQLKISNKVYSITDENGEYQIHGLQGTQQIKPFFYDYEFKTEEFEVNGSKTVDISGTNEKKYMVTFASFSNHKSASEIYGVTYEINGKTYNGDDKQNAFVENLTGKTVITPKKEGFVFEPAQMNVYSGTNAKFTAIPTSDRFTVSGTIDISGLDKEDYVQTVDIYVDGKIATQSYMDYSYKNDGTEVKSMKYRVDGLSSQKKGGYNISYKLNGSDSIQKINVTSATDKADFKYYVTKEVNLKFNIPGVDRDLDKLEPGYFFDFDMDVYDENDVLVHRYSGRDIIEEDVIIWRGCKIEIEGVFKEPDTIDDDGNTVYADRKTFKKTETITEVDMRKDYIGKYYEVRLSLRTDND